MYPFGSGMPQPTPPQNNHTHGMQSGAPFGGGWVTMPQSPQHSANGYPTAQSAGFAGYPPQNRGTAAADAGYLSQNQGAAAAAGYPSHASAQHTHYSQQRTSAHYPSQVPYLAAGGVPSYPTMKSNPYPGSSYPHNPQHPQQCPYPSSSSPGNNYQQQQAAAPYPSATHSYHSLYTSYPPTHGYQPISSVAGSGSPAVNMAHCFSEMTQRQNQSFAKKEGTPTVVPAPDFDPVKDAHDLKKAMKGFGTDEDTLINIICRRSNEQRQEIQRQYKTHFGKDLIEDIKSETSGNFEKLLVGLLLPIVDFYCTELCDAMAGIGTDEEVLVEVLCTLSNHEIHTIKNAYVRMYGAHLESELQSETSGNFKRLMVSLCTAARDESGQIDPVAAQNDARELLKAGELRVGTDESTFNMILCQRNYGQLKLIFQEYQNMTGHSLEKALKKEFSGDILAGLLAIYKCVTNKSEYFASRLHKSMAGIGTNDKQLVRVIVMRSEIDMQDIKTAFERMYGKSLKSWIKGDTSGHYKHALYALIGEQRSS